MMRWLIGASLKFRLLVVPIAAVLLVGGFMQLRNTPVDVLPEFTPPTVEIQTEALGLSAAEVEQLVTVPLEQDLLNGVAWLDEIRSESVVGLSSIQLIFEPGTDVLRARQMVQERMTQAHALPHVSKPPVMIQPVASTSRVMMVGLSSKNLSMIDMSVLARWRIKPRLMGVPGVANVAIWGQRERQLQVQVDPDKLAQSGVTLGQVVKTAGNALWVSPLSFVEASTPGTGGFVDTPSQRLTIQHILPIRTAKDLAGVRIEDTTDKPMTLGDVSQVVEDHQPLIGDAVVDDGQGLMLVIEKFPGANTAEVTDGVEEALESMRPGLSGVKIDTNVYRPATFLEQALRNVTTLLLVGLILVVALLALVMFDWRTAIVALVVIPLSLVVAAFVIQLRGGTFNSLLLAGLVLALGAVVGDVVNDTAAIRHRLREHRESGDERSSAAVVVEAAMETRGPLLYATLILVVAAIPVLLLPGITGSFARPLAISYLLAVLASMLVALLVTPALAWSLGSGRLSPRREPRVARGVQRRYGSLMSRTVTRWAAALAVAALLLLAGGIAWAQLGSGPVLPSTQDRNLLITWQAAPGMSQPEMVRITERASAELRTVGGVRNVGAHLGRAITSDQVVGVNSGEIWVTIDAKANYDRTVSKIQEIVNGYPGFEREVQTYPEQRVREVSTGSGDDIVVRVFGLDLDTLRGKANEVRTLVAKVDGVVEPKVDLPAEEPTVEIEVNLAAAQSYGLKPGDVRRAAATLLSGLQVGSLFEEQKVFDVVVWGAPPARQSLTGIQNLMIDTPDGRHVRLKDVADVRIKPNVSIIKHDAVSRRVDVTANVRGRSATAVASEIESKLRNVSFPSEYHAEVLGLRAERQSEQLRVTTVVIAAAILILLLLQAAFGSWRIAALVFLTLPVAVVGAVLAAGFTGIGLALGVVLGMFLVWSVAVRDSVLLVRHLQRAQRVGTAESDAALVERAAGERVVPVLVTAVAVALALLPAAFSGGGPGAEILRPMAIATIGGLITSTLLTIFIVPALYLRFGGVNHEERREAPEPAEERREAPVAQPAG
jgi:CzcA family heavy metal efflux pump